MTQDIFFNNNFCDIDKAKDIHFSEVFRVTNTRAVEGNYYMKDEALAFLEYKGSRRRNIIVTMPFNGIIATNNLRAGSKLIKNDLLFKCEKKEDTTFFEKKLIDQNDKKLNDIAITIAKDDFSLNTTIQFSRISGENTKFLKLYSENSISELSFFGISFFSFNNIPAIEFISTLYELKLAKEDSVIFLFDDTTKFECRFEKSRGTKFNMANIYPLTKEILTLFLTKRLNKIKVISSKNKVFDIFHFQNKFFNTQYNNPVCGQYLLQLMAKNYIKIHIDNNIKLPSS